MKKGLRTLKVLLCFMVFLVSTNVFSQGTYPNPRRFENDIIFFETLDKYFKPADNQILFVGSSSIGFWHQEIYWDMQPLDVVARGFGGSTTNDLNYYFDRIVTKYNPKGIVIYEGENDLAANVTPTKTLTELRKLIATIHTKLPGIPIYYLTIKPSPARWAMWPDMQTVNNGMATEAQTDELLTVIDVSTSLLGTNGEPAPELYEPDRLHLNEAGYAIWTDIIKPILLERFPTNKPVFIPSQTQPIINAALNKEVTVSGNYSNFFPGKNLTDGKSTTVWGSEATTDYQWFYVDLEDVYDVTEVTIDWYKFYYAYKFEFFVSDDAKNWTRIWTKYHGTGGKISYTVDLKTRYFAVLMRARHSIAYGISEFEVSAYEKEPVTFTDDNLEKVIRDEVGKPTGIVYKSNLKEITNLDAANRQIEDLSVLSLCENLTTLDVHKNKIADLTPLSNLTGLTTLNVSENKIIDLIPLQNIVSLTELDVSLNSIIDITPLSSLAALENVNLSGNKITDGVPLSSLKNCSKLVISDNQLINADFTGAMPALRILYLDNNPIFSAQKSVLDLSRLSGLEMLSVENTGLTDLTPITILTKLRYLSLNSNALVDITDLNSFSSLDWCFIEYNNLDFIEANPQGAINLQVVNDLKALGVKIYYIDGNLTQ